VDRDDDRDHGSDPSRGLEEAAEVGRAAEAVAPAVAVVAPGAAVAAEEAVAVAEEEVAAEVAAEEVAAEEVAAEEGREAVAPGWSSGARSSSSGRAKASSTRS
jgi:hypothetical protein